MEADPKVMAAAANGGLGGRLSEALTFDDVLLVPQRSDVMPREVDVSSRFSRNVPVSTHAGS